METKLPLHIHTPQKRENWEFASERVKNERIKIRHSIISAYLKWESSIHLQSLKVGSQRLTITVEAHTV